MAEFQTTSVTGSFELGTTPNTSSAGNMWYDTTTNQVKYSFYFEEDGIITGSL